MIGYHDIVQGLRKLGLDRSQPILVHASLSAFGKVRGDAETVVGALMASFNTLLVPTFTYKTMLVPQVGPPDNAIEYGSMNGANLMTEFFWADMPADRLMGIIPETLRRHSKAKRSAHPILSFSGVNAEHILETQSLEFPLGPIQALMERDGWVLLLGIDHNANTSIHLGEILAGRKTFIRWALTPKGVRECPNFPSCSKGFTAISPFLEAIVHKTKIGEASVQAMAVKELVEIVQAQIKNDPLALLCEEEDCQRCNAVRAAVTKEKVIG